MLPLRQDPSTLIILNKHAHYYGCFINALFLMLFFFILRLDDSLPSPGFSLALIYGAASLFFLDLFIGPWVIAPFRVRSS